MHCECCCEKHHRNGRIEYYHQMLGAVLVHPEHSEVIPLAPEPIVKGDGATKNDCERNASKRLLSDLRREHPHLKVLVVEDGLADRMIGTRQIAMGVDFVLLIILVLTEMRSYALGLKRGFC